MNKIKLIIVTVAALAVLGIAVYFSIFNSNIAGVSPTPTPTSQIGVSKTFTSSDLGISFQYVKYPDANMVIGVKEEGNKVYVFMNNTVAENGQFVEVFKKDLNETFEASIKRQILANFPSSKCKIEVSPSNIYTGGYVAEISYPAPTDPNQPAWANMKLCNENYANTNGIRYFLYDPNHPDKFLYFDIGQYAIPGQGTFETNVIPWQDTIQFK